jgi:hypothetical protein
MPVPPSISLMRGMTLGELLVWTYAEQRAHKYIATPRDAFLWAFDEAGLVLDPRDRRPVHRDAVTVHEAVLRPIELCGDAGHAWARSGRKRGRADPQRFCRHCAACAWLLIEVALSGGRPERITTEPQPIPIEPSGTLAERGYFINATGRREHYLVRTAETFVIEEAEYAVSGRKRVRRIGTRKVRVEVKYCPIAWLPDPEYIAMCERTADEWEQGMRGLRQRLRQAHFTAHRLVDDPST